MVVDMVLGMAIDKVMRGAKVKILRGLGDGRVDYEGRWTLCSREKRCKCGGGFSQVLQ
jgi:hypothetical protein